MMRHCARRGRIWVLRLDDEDGVWQGRLGEEEREEEAHAAAACYDDGKSRIAG